MVVTGRGSSFRSGDQEPERPYPVAEGQGTLASILRKSSPSLTPRALGRAELTILIAVLVFACGFAGIGAWAGGRQAWTVLLEVPGAVIPLMLALSLANYTLRAWRWVLFSDALSLGVPPASNVLYFVSGFAMTTTPGKMGETVRLYLLNRFHRCAYERTAAMLVGDRLSDAVAITGVVALTVFSFAHYAWIAALAVALVAVLVGLCLRPALLLRAIAAGFSILPKRARLFVRARRSVRALQSLAHPRIFGAALAMGAVGWACEGWSFFMLLHAMGAAVSPAAVVFVFAFGMLVGAISFLPGGLGSTEATMIGLLSVLGVPVDMAIVATGVVRVTSLWFAVVLGLLALPVAMGGAGRIAAAARGT